MLKPMLHWSIPLLIATAMLARQSDPNAKPLASLEGGVLNALTKDAVQKAHVRLESSVDAQTVLVATTDDAGHFHFADIEPGRYKLSAEKTGFLEGSYGSTKPAGEESLLRVEGESITNLSLSLFPGAEISGQVFDAEGDPCADHEVTLLAQRRMRGKVKTSPVRSTTADGTGHYRFIGLFPGTYYVAATADRWGQATQQILVDSSGHVSNLHDFTTFSPDSVSLADAPPIRVEIGQEQTGADIHIRRGRALSVSGKINGIEKSLSKLTLSASIDSGRGWTSTSGTIMDNGEFQIAQLPPGDHRLTLLADGPDGSHIIGQTKVNLTDHNLTEVVISPFKPSQVHIQVVMEGEEDKPLTVGSVFLNPSSDEFDVVHGYVQYQPQQGAYTIDSVSSGTYRVWFNNAKDSYLKSVRSGENTLNPNGVDVTEGADLSLRMTFSKNGASVEGEVDFTDDKPKKSAHVVLIAEDEDEFSFTKYQRPSLDQSLHFSITQMRPGRYLAFATEDEDPELWRDGEAVKLLRPKGMAVELHEREKVVLHLKPLARSETDRVRQGRQ